MATVNLHTTAAHHLGPENRHTIKATDGREKSIEKKCWTQMRRYLAIINAILAECQEKNVIFMSLYIQMKCDYEVK